MTNDCPSTTTELPTTAGDSAVHGTELERLLILRQELRSAGHVEKAALCDCEIAWLYVRLHDYPRADRHFERATNGFREAGLHHHQANVQWSRARRMLAEASEDDARRDELIASAIDIATASWIACEHERFQFDDAARRRRWALIADRRLAATLSLAYEHGSAALVAELIDSGLNAGSHSADADFGDEDAGADPGGEKLSFWSTELWVDVSSDSRSVVTTDDAAGSQSSSHRSEAAARLLDNRELAMEPPAELRYPINSGTHRVVLGPQREMAAALDPDLRVIFTSVPTVEAW